MEKSDLLCFKTKQKWLYSSLKDDNLRTLYFGPLKLGEQQISFKSEVKYLDIILDKKLNLKNDIQERVQKAMSREYSTAYRDWLV